MNILKKLLEVGNSLPRKFPTRVEKRFRLEIEFKEPIRNVDLTSLFVCFYIFVFTVMFFRNITDVYENILKRYVFEKGYEQ